MRKTLAILIGASMIASAAGLATTATAGGSYKLNVAGVCFGPTPGGKPNQKSNVDMKYCKADLSFGKNGQCYQKGKQGSVPTKECTDAGLLPPKAAAAPPAAAAATPKKK